MPKRVDILLAEQGLARSRTEAQHLIAAGRVSVSLVEGRWQPVSKASERFDADVSFQVETGAEQAYVSRAGLKLEQALTNLSLEWNQCIALDIGQSTGGFTDCLLQRGVKQVVGVDVGRDQLVPGLRSDARVTVLENYNARELSLADFPSWCTAGFDLVVMDVSFISQHLILPKIPPVMKPGAYLISLVKPQFEVGKAAVGKGGIVRDAAAYARVKTEICSHFETLGLRLRSYFESPVKGGDGNREFLAVGQKIAE